MAQGSQRRRWLFAGVATAAAAAGLGGAWWQQGRQGEPGASGGERLGPEFWAQRFDRPEGGELALASLQGRPLLINFWATWCPPCVEELPMLDRFFVAQGERGVQVIGLAVDQPSAVRKFLARAPVAFANGMAGMQGTDLARQLGNAAGGLPFTLMIHRSGQVLARKMGKLEAADLQAWGRAEFHG
ncbi:TlpA disulfide reductase family protein [Xenophilus arseniciresistens]|uniref:TlpA disulfide reductase family protein n=1 Tax=Xenophilus arseniciresistens TaxID=1283306 RepID=A0AAE3NAE4_9BURK|nr:TlpA disulfide reductase family protein [Xenophilus arseniciresistens]MDA7417903.1 TlpA disulfide reductase family protein [Xenophilus arseniciresistens]